MACGLGSLQRKAMPGSASLQTAMTRRRQSRVLSARRLLIACVISSGATYAVDPRKSESYECTGVTPVLDVRPILKERLLVVSDFTRLTA